mmetsp:Transcript_3800/g.5025  ORF Transcript_3800/g.5025 Transcript_3800/m.5025 type:complete len:86 (+) Transcript_3800:481-738(+)
MCSKAQVMIILWAHFLHTYIVSTISKERRPKEKARLQSAVNRSIPSLAIELPIAQVQIQQKSRLDLRHTTRVIIFGLDPLAFEIL